MDLHAYVTKRLLLFVPTLLLASLVVFAVMRALPGDVTSAFFGGQGEALRPELAAAMRAELGLDDPLPVQYGRWAWSMVNGELGGRSLATRQPVAEVVGRALPVTLQLAGYAVLVAVLVWVPLGALAAASRGGPLDAALRLVAVAGTALPGFWVGLFALLLVVLLFGWSPPLVYGHLWQRPLDHLQMMAIPALVLSWEYGGHLLRSVRSGTVDALAQDFVRTARSKGVREGRVILRHALRAAAVPLVTVAGVHLGSLLSGAVVLEFVFGLPGIGRSLVGAVIARDYPVVQSLAMVLVALVLVLNLILDLLYAALDPRVSYDG